MLVERVEVRVWAQGAQRGPAGLELHSFWTKGSKWLDSESLERHTHRNINQLESFIASFWPYSILLSLFLSLTLTVSNCPSFLPLLSSASPWLTRSYSSRFNGSGGELGPLWRHSERYWVSSMICVSLFITRHHHHRPRPPTTVARVLSSVITGGRAPSCVPAPLPLSHQPSVRWTFCCYLFSLSWLCLFTAPPRRPRSIHRSQHRNTATGGDTTS